MAAPGQSGQSQEAPLEDRLRGLILSHSGTPSGQQPQEQGHHAPTHQHDAPVAAQPGQDNPPGLSPSGNQEPLSAPKNSRKRPNQAQRRQMSAQLSIPIDTRPQFNQSQRPYGNPQGHQGQHHHRGGHHRFQQPRSATFRPPSHDNPPPNAPLTGGQFPPRSRHQSSHSYNGPMSTTEQSGWPQPQVHHGDPRVSYQMPGMPFMPPGSAASSMHLRQGSSHLNSPGGAFVSPEELLAQAGLLEGLCNTIVADAEIDAAEIRVKEHFRIMLEQVARSAITEYERSHNGFQDFPPESVQLKCFGSLASGFATKASDMDLGVLSPLSLIPPDAPGSPIPRIVEKAFLDIGLGARLLTQTRVPIIKVCENPPDKLRLALLDERAKWEKGVVESGDEEETHDDLEPHPTAEVQVPPEDKEASPEPEAQFQEDTLTVEQRLERFRQDKTSSLSGYYGSAKRLFRNVGGRDITHSNVAEFKTEDIVILNKVILAFIDGLADSKLRDRLLGYRSLNRYDLTSHANNRRTLLGALTQVEGEQMAMLWESRLIQEKDMSREAAAENLLKLWNRIQDRPDYGRDPLGYQKDLQSAVEQLKKIPSIQVLLLSQAQNESASSYCARALRLMHELAGYDSRPRLDTILPTLIRHYIGGISNQAIREQVQEFQKTHNVSNVRAIGRRHKTLQLAHDYEICLSKGLYADDTATNVRQYIELLQAPIAASPSGGHVSGTIPLPPGSASLLCEIRLLGDPSKASPNQPRDRYSGILEFPKSGVGVQCDINFSAHLAVQNTLLLRCYSHCDPRMRPLVLFVKHWAKVRRINTPYRGTLGSYGYSLMMLHYLINIAQPFVLPNLQELARPPGPNLTPQQVEETVQVKGRNIQFWRDEAEIVRLARDNVLTQNRESVGELLRGFFEYYAKGGSPMSNVPCRSFDWGRDVLSLRTHGGLLTKQAKGWTGAKTVVEEVPSAAPPPTSATTPDTTTTAGTGTGPGPSNHHTHKKEVRYRYLFAIEDPFELDHNIARTVTHSGIVNIRDEFRRAWRIIRNAGRSVGQRQGGAHGQGQVQGQQGQQGQQGSQAAGGHSVGAGLYNAPGPGQGMYGNGGYGQAHTQDHAQGHGHAQAHGHGQGHGQAHGHGQGHGQAHGHGPHGGGNWKQEDLLEDVGKAEEEREREAFVKLLEDLHGVGLGQVDAVEGAQAVGGETV